MRGTDSPLGCQIARRGAVEVDGRFLAFLESGGAGRPPLCFLHGGAAHAHWFDAVTPSLADRFRVIALDQRGHGESAWTAPPAYATEDFAGDLLGLMGRLGWERMTLVGHSMGGHNAMAFAAWHPTRVAALVIVDARPVISSERVSQMRERGQRRSRGYASLDAAVTAFRLLPPDTVADPGLLAHVAAQSFVARNGGFARRFDPACYASRQPTDAWPLLPRITSPTLIVRGARSPVLPRDMAEQMRQAIPDATLVEVPDAYHHVVLDRPAAFTALVASFLEARSGRQGRVG